MKIPPYFCQMKLSDWKVNTVDNDCVKVNINEDVSINDTMLTLFNENRIPIVKMKVESREVYLCCHAERPMFIQVGDSVRYVDGSGYEAYEKIFKPKFDN